MKTISAALIEGLRGMARFSGRMSRAAFWIYAGFVFLLFGGVVAVLMLPEIFGSIARMQRFAAENPELATVTSGPGHYSVTIEGHHPELMPDMDSILHGIAIALAATMLLLAAAVVRRLHDAGKSGWWGLMPVPFLILPLVLMPRLFAGFGSDEPDIATFLLLFLNNLFYLGTIVALGMLLARPGTPGLDQGPWRGQGGA